MEERQLNKLKLLINYH